MTSAEHGFWIPRDSPVANATGQYESAPGSGNNRASELHLSASSRCRKASKWVELCALCWTPCWSQPFLRECNIALTINQPGYNPDSAVKST